jgi:hypothetical protein
MQNRRRILWPGDTVWCETGWISVKFKEIVEGLSLITLQERLSRQPNLNTLSFVGHFCFSFHSNSTHVFFFLMQMGERRGTKALELWCRRMVEGYNVRVDNMTTSWRNGMAFCALVSKCSSLKQMPDLM